MLISQHKQEFNIENADVIGICTMCNIACMQIFLYRFGQFMGHKTFFFDTEELDFDNLNNLYEAALWQYYSINKVPEEIIINQNFQFCALKQAILDTFNVDTKIIYPLRGPKHKAIIFAEHNCEHALREQLKHNEISKYKLEKIQTMFNLPTLPKRIEVYDNSHIMGKYPIGVMIVVLDGKFTRSEYRKYHLKLDKFGGDDYFLLKTVLSERCKKILKLQSSNQFLNLPDLILVDGGKGHLSTAKKILQDFNLEIPIVAIAKSEFRNKGNEKFFTLNQVEPIILDNSDEIMQYLQVMRDEAHNFAIKSHRFLRSKNIIKV